MEVKDISMLEDLEPREIAIEGGDDTSPEVEPLPRFASGGLIEKPELVILGDTKQELIISPDIILGESPETIDEADL